MIDDVVLVRVGVQRRLVVLVLLIGIGIGIAIGRWL